MGQREKFTWYCAGALSGSLYIGGKAKHYTEGYRDLYGASVSGIVIKNKPFPDVNCAYVSPPRQV
jgi:hypothetical protein